MAKKEKVSGIYQIRCMVSDRKYVGRSINIAHRFNNHRSAFRTGVHDNRFMQRIYDKYGDVFEYKILLKTFPSQDVLEIIEQIYIDSGEFQLNLSKSSLGGSGDGKVKLGSEEVNQLLVEYINTGQSLHQISVKYGHNKQFLSNVILKDAYSEIADKELLRKAKAKSTSSGSMTEKEVIAVFERYSDNIPMRQISNEMGRSITLVSNILNKKSYVDYDIPQYLIDYVKYKNPYNNGRIGKPRKPPKIRKTQQEISLQRRKLTDDQVIEMRKIIGTTTQKIIAEKFGVSESTVRNVIKRRKPYNVE